MPSSGSYHRHVEPVSSVHTMSSRLPSSPPRRSYYDLPPPGRPHYDQHHGQRRASLHHALPPIDARSAHGHVDILPPTSASALSSASFLHQPASNSLPASVQRPMHQLVPEQQLQLTNIHRFTPSCSRCRQKKLKCDTNLPCNQCIAKGVHDECRKDPRVPRGRKRPKLAATSSSDKPEDEITALRKRVKELEQMVARRNDASTASQPASPSTSHHQSSKQAISSRKFGTSSRGSQTTGPSEIGFSNSRDHYSAASPSFDSEDDEPGETEASLATLERLAASDPRVSEPGHGKAMHKQINSVLPRRIPRRASGSYFAAPAAFNERIEILRLAKRLLPEKPLVDTLIYTFNLRCHHLVGRIVHMPSCQKDIDFFTYATVEELLTSPLDMYDLARYLMILRLGMRFYPWKGNMFIDDTTPEFIAINALKNRGDDISLQWLNLAKRALALDRNFSLNSLQAIQTAILMVLDGRDSPTYLRMLLRMSIQTALDMGLHRLGDAMPSAKNPDDDIVHIETGVRIWWYLVVKDWCSAQREGAYTIHPSQMTTRKPLHTTDARLSEGLAEELPRDQHCEASYTLCQIELANIIRESIDLRNEQSTLGGAYDVISPTNKKLLHVKLETFLDDLPPFYRLDSTEMRPGILAVQRCLLHQQTFDVLLKLNRKSLSSYSERATCTMLAEQIVSTQKLLRSVCPVIDGFWVNFLHLFGATLTLTISLLLDDDLTDETRERRRSKVQTALATMRETPGSDRGSRIIEALLEEEQRQWIADQKEAPSKGAHRTRSLDLGALTKRIVAQNAELAEAPAPIESASSSSNSAQNGIRSGAVGALAWDTTPDESVIPAFASSWGIVTTDATDPTDPMGLLNSFVPQPEAQDGHGNGLYPNDPYMYQRRSYEHSLRPWQEPSEIAAGQGQADIATNTNENNLWDWVFSQAALLHGPEPPIEGPPRAAATATTTTTTTATASGPKAQLSPSAMPAWAQPNGSARADNPMQNANRPPSDTSSHAYPHSYNGGQSLHSARSHAHSRSPRLAPPSVFSPWTSHESLYADRGAKLNTHLYSQPLPPLRGWPDPHPHPHHHQQQRN